MIYVQNGATSIIIPINSYQRKCITQNEVLYCEKTQIPDIPPMAGVILAITLLLCMVIGAIKVARDLNGDIMDYVMGSLAGFLFWVVSILMLAFFGFLLKGFL